MGICRAHNNGEIRPWVLVLSAVLSAATAASAQVDVLEAFRQGTEAYVAGQYATAAERFSACREAAPAIPEYGLWHSAALLRLGAYREALPILNAVIQLSPDSAEAHTNLGLVWHQLGSPEAAITELRAALDLAPDSDVTRGNLAAVLLGQGRTDEAEALWRERLDAGLATAPVHRGMALALERRGQYEAALAEALLALELSPGDPETVAMAARLHLRAGDARTGMAQMSSIAHPTVAQVEAFAAALLASGAPMDAVAHLEQPGVRENLTASGLATLAEGLRQEQRWESLQGVLLALVAHEDFERRWWPQSRAPALATLGWLSMRAGDGAAASDWAQRALALDPEQSLAKRIAQGGSGPGAALAAFEAELLAGSRDLTTARYVLLQGVRSPEYRPTPALIGAVYGWLPDDGALLHALGVLALRVGDPGQATPILERAAEMSPDDAAIANNLGAAYELGGRIDEALAAYALAVRLDPDLAEAASNLDRLRGEGDG